MKPAACREPSASSRKRAFATLDVKTEVRKVLGQRFQSELVAVRRLLKKAIPPSSAPAIQRAEAANKRKASPPLPVTQRSDQAPKKMTAGEAADLAQLDVTKIAEEDEEIDIVGGVSPLSTAPAPLLFSVEEDEYVDVCGDASPVLMTKNLGQEDVISSSSSDSSSSSSDSGSDSSSSDSDSDSSSSDSDSESGESVSSPAPAERASDDKDVDVAQPPAAASALAVPDDQLDDDIFAVNGAWFNDFCGGSMDMSTCAGVDLLEIQLDRESSVHLAAAAGRRPAVNLSRSLSSSESESSMNSGGGTKRRLPQQQKKSAPTGQRKLQQTESAVVVEGGGSSNNGGYWCRHCAKVETPQWRAGPEGPNTLCNECGLRYKNRLAMAAPKTTTKRLPPAAKPRGGAKRKNRSVSAMPSTAVKKKR